MQGPDNAQTELREMGLGRGRVTSVRGVKRVVTHYGPAGVVMESNTAQEIIV